MKLLGVIAILFAAGFMENSVNAWQVRSMSHGRALQSFLGASLYVMVWFTALRFVVENLQNWWIAAFYALGSGCGSMSLVLWSKYYAKRNLNETTSASRSSGSMGRRS